MEPRSRIGIDFSKPKTTNERIYTFFSYALVALYGLSYTKLTLVDPETLDLISYAQQFVTGGMIMWFFRPPWLPLIGRVDPLTRIEYNLAFSAGMFLVVGLVGQIFVRYDQARTKIKEQVVTKKE